MTPISQQTLHVTKYEVLGVLPDLLTFEKGTPITDKSDWEKRREELYTTAVELQYGTLPPKPEFLDVETLYIGAKVRSYRIHTGTKNNPVSFLMKLILLHLIFQMNIIYQLLQKLMAYMLMLKCLMEISLKALAEEEEKRIIRT